MRGAKETSCFITQMHVITVVLVEVLWHTEQSSPAYTAGVPCALGLLYSTEMGGEMDW